MRVGFKAENWKDRDGLPAGGVVSGTGFTISWQNGPLEPSKEERAEGLVRRAPNGAFVEDVIDAAQARLKYYQYEAGFPCEETESAIDYLERAMDVLDGRTVRRTVAKTEGTHDGS